MPKQTGLFGHHDGEEDDSGCDHDHIEFDRAEPHGGGDLIVHVRCRDCGRSGSTTLQCTDIRW